MGRYHLGKGYRRCFGLWNSGDKRITSEDFPLFVSGLGMKGERVSCSQFYVLCFAFPISFSRHAWVDQGRFNLVRFHTSYDIFLLFLCYLFVSVMTFNVWTSEICSIY